VFALSAALLGCGKDDGGGGGGSGGDLPTGQCRQTADCSQPGDTCVSPDFDVGCGACQEPLPEELCVDDQECKGEGEPFICAPVQCPCSGQANTCTPGCTSDDDCPAHLECDATNRCSAKSCGGETDCPANYGCSGGSCARRSCSSDADCEGYCVDGTCYADPGWCWDGSQPP
jgi:hypothetical protein